MIYMQRMKLKRFLVLAVLICLCICISACTQTEDSNITESTAETLTATEPQVTEQSTTEPETQITEQPTTEPIQLNNTYTTNLTEINGVVYPAFSFDYPDNWSVTNEECGSNYESVTLENKSGAVIWFSHIDGEKGQNIGGGSNLHMSKIEVSEIADSQFIPDVANKSLGDFMVAKLEITGVLDMRTDLEYTDVVDDVPSYAVLPKSEVGLREGVTKAISGEFTFYYGANISFVGTIGNEDFTEENQQEVIAILNSFRLA